MCPQPSPTSQHHHRQRIRNSATDRQEKTTKRGTPDSHNSYLCLALLSSPPTHHSLNEPPSLPSQCLCTFCSLCLERSSLQLHPCWYMILTFRLVKAAFLITPAKLLVPASHCVPLASLLSRLTSHGSIVTTSGAAKKTFMGTDSSRAAWVQVAALPLPSCMPSSKCLNFSGCQRSTVQWG